ncbi:MAG TPA: hypothetical protein VFO93_11920 [Hymenobacter sp.]|uniref:hypothetical protein n=1 Tax=Hymenobacter sp. TaxID=1898978 RepID=UPI002D7E9E42|nr:hypothetical protein [Hymenobacter sp.]HET9504241.1 hypothetical protein [Hymenobacter sp.]
MTHPTVSPLRERIRILLIIYNFSEPYSDPDHPNWARILRSEVKIQKIDFLFRYPSYLCNELLREHEAGTISANEVRGIVRQIFVDNEPQLRTDEMKRFFFGAYNGLDTTLSALKSLNLIDLRSQHNALLKKTNKEYFITHFGAEKITRALSQVPAAQWYIARCELIKHYFGYLSGSDLKRRQYDIETYRETPLDEVIADIENEVRERYFNLFNDSLPL